MANIQKKYIGILGGSFDPVHKGHLSISKIAIRKFKLKKIYWVVTKKNPFKNKTFYSLNERVKLAKKISRTQKKIQTIHLENIIKSPRTIDMINYFIRKKNIKNIYFIVGSDNLIRFHKWKSWKKIVKLVKLIVFSRRGYDRKGMKSTVVKNFKNKIIFIKNKHITISSTQLKNQLSLNN